MKAIIFDMDGVLTDSMKYHLVSWQKAFNKSNLFPTIAELGLLEGMAYDKTVQTISDNHKIILTDEQSTIIINDKKKILSEIFKFETYPGIMDFLFELKKQNLKLALVTGSNKKHTAKVVTTYFKNIFDAVITADDVKEGKPSPEPFLKALEQLKVNSSDAIVIENAPLGITSAKKAGLKVLALETTLPKKELIDANMIFKNHQELFGFVNSEI